jgi:N-glycosylase/DNA lyase
MKKSVIALLALGLIEIAYGVLVGRLQIYAFEVPMIRDVRIQPTEYREFGNYITRFKDQWHVVAIFGVTNIVIALFMYARTRKGFKPLG